jgi:hypothetical protein
MPDLSRFESIFHRFGHTTIKILMVVDGSIRTVEGPNQFGIGRVARLIEDLERGCSSFTVDTARRQPHFLAAENSGHISTSFRFDAQAGGSNVIDGYDQIWLFGINGEFSAGLDASELRVLTAWMNRGGGIFATGDHEDLGAALCGDIPRVREMRRWTQAQGVPPIGGFQRLDTNRPTNAAEATGASPMAFAHEADTTPQPIDWVPVWSYRAGFLVYERPHEVLCHPDLGPIDVMPDHPHEGRTREVSEMNLAASYDFGGGVAGSDFPNANSGGPLPLVIAHGDTAPAPPTSKPYKGNCGAFRFPMISVYDGRSAGVKGRVAVDSTWHHWFDLNIHDLEHAADDTAWRKIRRYFENLAVWLAPAGRFRHECWVIKQWFEYPLVEEFANRRIDASLITPEIAGLVRGKFTKLFGPCTTSSFVWGNICDLHPKVCKGLFELDPRRIPEPWPPVCLTCPPFELFEDVVFEGLLRATLPFMDELEALGDEVERIDPEKLQRRFAAHASLGVEEAVHAHAARVLASLEHDRATWANVLEVTPRGAELLAQRTAAESKRSSKRATKQPAKRATKQPAKPRSPRSK